MNYDIGRILKACDHTILKPESTWNEIKTVLDEAMEYGAASACIPPGFVREARRYMDSEGMVNKAAALCTVVGFPSGYASTETKVFETKDAVANGADEIDMVINVGRLKEGDEDFVKREIEQVRRSAQGKVLKVIVETCLLTKEEIVTMCRIVTETGADFIKTSTGFGSGGATFEDVKLMAEHVGPGVGIKASGGIGSLEDAGEFLALGATRLGTSKIIGLVKEMERAG